MTPRAPAGRYELGVDIGGTFTDIVLRDTVSGDAFAGKTLTTAHDPAAGALAAVRRLLQASGVPPGAVVRAVHGTTLVTNTIIERKGARTAYITSAGFADVFEVGRQKRYDMYDLGIRFPEPLVPRLLRFEVHERVDASGRVRVPLDPAQVRNLAARFQAAGVEAVAICFLHSYLRPEHERQAGKVLREAAPHLDVSISADVAPGIREYPRASTTAANAYVARITRGYLARLQAGLRAIGCPAVMHVMLSHGGLATIATASRFPIRLLESGPAGGALAAAYHAARMRASARTPGSATGTQECPPARTTALALDMGGTTAKVCLLENGVPRITSRFETARVHRVKRGSGLPIAVPSVDLIEIGAGGGSIVRLDRLGLLRVGPESAGADPGPACYGRGGIAPTVTDADLLLGYLDAGTFLDGELPLDVAAARTALAGAIAAPLGVQILDAAWAVHAAVNEQMADAVRVHAAERGVDVRALDVIAFGGAGPVHAERLARVLRLRRLVVPYGAGVASSLGFLVAPLSFDFAASSPQRLGALNQANIEALYAPLVGEGRALLGAAGVAAAAATLDFSCDMRYTGQGYEIRVPFDQTEPWRFSLSELRHRFEIAYRALYGRVHDGAPVEAVTWRLVARGPRPGGMLRHAGPKALSGDLRARAWRGTRPAYAPEAGTMVPFDVYRRPALRPGDKFAGPAVVEERESTAVLGPGAIATVDDQLNLIISPVPGMTAARPAPGEATVAAGGARRGDGASRAVQEQLT